MHGGLQPMRFFATVAALRFRTRVKPVQVEVFAPFCCVLPGPAELVKELLHGHLVPLLSMRSFPGSLSGDLRHSRGRTHLRG